MSTFGNGRVLTARSVILSVLLGSDPPRLSPRRLVGTTDLFGITEGTTRTALSRLTAAGELTMKDGRYELSSQSLLRRRAHQTASRMAETRDWDGSWIHAVTGTEQRRAASDRAALRGELARQRLAELREGVWLRPDNLPDDDAGSSANGEVVWFVSEPVSDAVALAQRLWDLDGWASEATNLRHSMGRLIGPLEEGDRSKLAEGFVLSASVLRQFQADPLLPTQLLPSSWPGQELRSQYDRYDAAYRAVLKGWFREYV